MMQQPQTQTPRPGKALGLQMRVPESRLQDMEKAEASKKAEDTAQSKPEMISLASHVTTAWQAALRAKQADNIEQRFLRCMRRRKGEYDPEKLVEIQKFGGSKAYMMLTNIKCRAAESWLRDILLPPGEKPWGLRPTPKPELPEGKQIEIEEQVKNETVTLMLINGVGSIGVDKIQDRLDEIKDKVQQEIMQKAKASAARFETHIHDQLTEGSYYTALSEFITDIVTVPTAFIKGPVIRRKKKLVWTEDQEGNWVPAVEISPVREYQRISGLDMYPSPGAKNLQDGYLCERARVRRGDLVTMIGVEGFRETAIRQVLQEYGEGGLRHWLAVDQERARVESRPEENQDPDPPIDCIIFWGSVQGKKLLEWGMDKNKVPDADVDYQVTAWLIGQYVVMARLNPHPLGKRPYFCASYESTNDSIWGQSVPELMEDCQDVCNAAARSLINNMAIACLTGDTIVYREAQDRKYASITLNELWVKKHQHNSGLRRIKLRSLDEENGEFISNRIVDIVDNGIVDVFEVVTQKGYSIKATGNHRFMRSDGTWQLLDEFDIGDLIAVNGQKKPHRGKCIKCGAPTARIGVRCRSCASKAHNSKWNQKQIKDASSNINANPTTARARFECQSKKKDFCEGCGKRFIDDEKLILEVHHKDRVPWNNAEDNLQTLCSSCHHKLHAKEDSFGDPYLHRYISYDQIVSIEYIGKEKVFDLCMQDPNHNFVANGFVSHNSGPQVEVFMNRLQPTENAEDIYPWKIWKTEDPGTGANNPAVNFFQPDPIVDVLLKVFEYFFKQASEQTGIPAYIYGSDSIGGAGDTASGLSMLMNAAGKTLKGVIARIDDHVISPSIKEHWNHIMLYDTDIEKTGDINVVARASEELIIAEQLQLRRSEMLDRTNNDWDRAIIGMKGRAQMLREAFKSMKMDTDKIVPTQDEIETQIAAAEEQARAELGLVGGNVPGVPPAAVVDAAGNRKGQPPGQTIQGRGKRSGVRR